MNLLLFNPNEFLSPLPVSDPRTVHVREILRAKNGDCLQLGEIGGSTGVGEVKWSDDGRLGFESVVLDRAPPPPLPLGLIIGTPRPPTARRLLRDLASLGVERLHWTASKLGERSYLHSPLWKNEGWKAEVLLGAMQGRTTLLPRVSWTEKFQEVFQWDWPASRFYLRPQGEPWPRFLLERAVVAVGPERGFTADETRRLEKEAFLPLGLGPMTLRTETAALAAAVLARELWFSP